MEVVLASGSPRRRDLLGRLGVTFRTVVAHTEEISAYTDPAEVALDLARQKAVAARALEPRGVIVAADTLVALGSDILGKPEDAAENVRFLRRLSGRTHTVHTGVAVLPEDGEADVRVASTLVTFRELGEAECAWYAASGEGLDKAGGYGIQDLGLALVANVEGDYSNVVGFPLPLVIGMLRRAGVAVLGNASTGARP